MATVAAGSGNSFCLPMAARPMATAERGRCDEGEGEGERAALIRVGQERCSAARASRWRAAAVGGSCSRSRRLLLLCACVCAGAALYCAQSLRKLAAGRRPSALEHQHTAVVVARPRRESIAECWRSRWTRFVKWNRKEGTHTRENDNENKILGLVSEGARRRLVLRTAADDSLSS
jgi:hypothetical protein